MRNFKHRQAWDDSTEQQAAAFVALFIQTFPDPGMQAAVFAKLTAHMDAGDPAKGIAPAPPEGSVERMGFYHEAGAQDSSPFAGSSYAKRFPHGAAIIRNSGFAR